jgi:hypothetical protein
MSWFLDYNNGTILQRLKRLVEYLCQSVNHVGGPCVVKAKKNYADTPVAQQGQYLAEIQVEPEHGPHLRRGLDKDLSIGQSVETLVVQMADVVAWSLQPFGHGAGRAHVGKETQAIPLLHVHLLLSQPCRVLESLPDILKFKVWVVFQYLSFGSAVGELTYDYRNRNSHSADARTPPRILGSNVIRSNIGFLP